MPHGPGGEDWSGLYGLAWYLSPGFRRGEAERETDPRPSYVHEQHVDAQRCRRAIAVLG
jgi:hypothetical protein